MLYTGRLYTGRLYLQSTHKKRKIVQSSNSTIRALISERGNHKSNKRKEDETNINKNRKLIKIKLICNPMRVSTNKNNKKKINKKKDLKNEKKITMIHINQTL